LPSSTEIEPKRKRRPEPVEKLPPHSIEAEQGVLGSILLSPDCLTEVSERLKLEAFYDLRHQLIFGCFQSLGEARRPIDEIAVIKELKARDQLDQIGGRQYLSELLSSTPSAANVSYWIDIVFEQYRRRAIIAGCQEIIDFAMTFDGNEEDFLFAIGGQIRDVLEPKQRFIGESASWKDLIDFQTVHDPNNVIGMRDGKTTRYLCRGHLAWLIGPSGVGKSALLFQFGAAWAVGKPMFGITPMRPLRVLLVQAENDKGDLAEMARGIEAGLDLQDFAEIEKLEQNIRVRSVKGRIGKAFCAWLREEIEDFKADLVLVDPLLSFAGIDVSRQDQVSQFCRLWLDPVLHETGAVLISAHHTGKPPSQQKNQLPQTLTDLAYAGIGSSELVNYARAVMLLQTVGEGVFRLQLAKRGRRACATHPDLTPTQTLWLKHASNGTIFWVQVDPPEENDSRSDPKEPKLTKPQQIANCNLGTFLSKCPPDGEGLREIVRRLKTWLGSKDSPQKSLASISDGSIRKALEIILDNEKLSFSDNRYFKGPNA
jgi:hypothetical protein